MAGIKVQGRLPDGDLDGLTAAAQAFVDKPHDMHVVVAVMDTRKIETDQDSGDQTAIARIRRIEVITNPEDGKTLTRIMVRELERRTGATVLPLDLEDALLDVFAGLDRETGELTIGEGDDTDPGPSPSANPFDPDSDDE